MSISLKYITDTHGERTEVILPVQEYEQMLEEMQILRARAMRKDLLSLSPTEREDILKQQTNGMVDFYQTDTQWRELDQVNDIHDYDE